jgi:hypothetical protein
MSVSLSDLTETCISGSLNQMNESVTSLRLRSLMTEDDGWGRIAGREVYQRLMEFVEANPGTLIFRISLQGVRRIDISFASETIVEIARRYRGRKGFCFGDVVDTDQRENWDAAALRADQPITSWDNSGHPSTLGPQPSEGNSDAYRFALTRPEVRAAEYAASVKGISITNASSKFKQLWEQGFLLRRDFGSQSGGVEYVYCRIR